MIKSTVLLCFIFMVAVKCQDTRPGGQREISQEEMNQPCPIYRQPSDDCPSSTCTGSVCSTPENPVCCSDGICGDVCRPNMTKCVDTDIFIENAIGFCLSDFAIAIGASKFSEYCVHLNKGLTCMLEKYNLEKEIYRDECLNRMKAYVKYNFDSVTSKLAAFGISYNVSNVNRSELCMTGKCRPDICTNQGLCTELYEDYKCNCSTSAFNSSQDGKSCSKVMGITLQTNNMIKINFDTAARLPNTVGVTVLTMKKQGILMQMTNAAEPRMTISLLINNNGGIKFVLEAGFTRYEVNTYVNTDDISDGKPHRVGVRLDRDNRKIYLHLDRLAPVVADIGNEVNFESLGFNYLYIGNNDTSSSSYGFEGCINSMNIDRMFPLKMALSTPTPSNVMLVPNGDIVKTQCDMDGSTNEPDDDKTPDDGEGGSDDDSDEDWNTKCPEIDDIDTELCPRQCVDSCSTDNDVCCSIGSNTQCTLCIPDMSQCGDIRVIKSKIRSCASDVQLALESVEIDNFCTNFWSAMKCIANDIAGDNYDKLCQKRMIVMMTRSNVNVLDAFSEIIGLRVTDAARQFYRSVVRCRESPVYVEPNRPRPDGVDECSETNTIISQGRTCLEKLTETDDPLCSKLKRFVQCVAFKIYPEEREGSIKLKQCGDEITEIIRENIERLKTQLRPLGRFDLDDCEEKEVVCGGKSLEDVDCNTQSCPANYECQKGHCCPVERPGQCPKRSGTPLCLEKCDKDSDCDDKKKCCNMGCGNSTCVESVMFEKTSCEMDLENAKKQLRKNGLCGDGKTVVALPRCLDNGRYDPIQGDIANGLLYCVDEKGKKIEGSDFRGNRDCTTVRPGKCRAKPDICTTDSGIIATCDSDQDCKTKGQKCCYGLYQNLCVRQCVDPITDDDDVLDTCTDRKCCPINLCNGKICSKDPSAVCRINSCGNCTVEFYNAMGELVDCEEGVSECEKARTRAKESNKDRRDGGENEDERLENFIQMLDKRRNRSGGDGMDDDDDDYDDNDRDDDDDNDDSEDIDDDEAPTGRRLMLAEGTLCHLFDTYGLCQYGSYCILCEGESTWEICNCSVAADGRHGLFCDSLDRTYQGSQCARDRGRIVDLLDILKNAAKVKENKALHSMFTTLKIPYIIKPECIDVMQNFSPVQKALALPRTSRAKDFYVCVDEINGKRIEYTPVSFNASQPPNCTIVNDMYPDLLTVSKKCVIPSPGDCLTEPCDYYWNIATGECEQGFIRNGFRSASECYDACTVQPSCSEDLTTTEITDTESDEDYCVQEFGVGPLPCQSADKTKSECDFATEFCNVTVTNGLQTGQCESFPQRCLLAPDSGVGDKKLGRYAYDAKQRRCVKLLYKGEGGNKNRFETVHQCNTECSTRKYKYDDFACPPSTSLENSGGGECYEDNDCPGDNVCCSDGTKLVCTMHVKTCSYGQRCPVDGAYCDNGKCVCLDCADAELAPVCGSDGETYESECHLKQYVCKTLKPISKQSDGECPTDICDVTDCDSTTVVCGRGQMYGAVRTFTSECAMNKESCDGEEQYIKVPKENCDVSGTDCTKMCTLQYEPVCAYVRSTGGDEFKNYSNKCIMMRDKVCSDKDVHFLYDGECKGCGATNQMCQPYEECVNGVCGCRPGCTKEYNPVCAFEIDNPAKLEEFANDCLRRNHSCATKSIYIKKYDDRPCKKPEPIHVCPRTRRDIVRSATFQCNDVTNAFCDKDKEMCCPYGAGRRCIPKTRLIKKTRQKVGECPVQSPYNTDIEQCEHKCTDDSDCAGDAKCCSNMICGFDTCVAPKVKDPSTICGPNLRMLEDITCDPTSSDSGCPYGTCTQVTLKDGTTDAVCCVNEFQRTVVADLTGAELCIALKNVNVTCMNGGKCAANSTSGKICECQAGYYGLFCENKKPSDCATVQCFANPCNVTKCEAIPGATCKPNYCDGCHALFSYQGMDVTEKCKETVCLRRKTLFDKISSIIKRSRANQRELLRRIGEASEEDDRDDRDHDDSRDVDEHDEELDDNDVGRDTFIDGLLAIVARIPGYVGFPNETISCTSRGNFAEKQCVKNDRGAFCFCADATTGAPIPRTRRARTIKDLDCTMTADTENAPDFCHDETPDMTTECDETETLRFYFDSEALRCKGFKDKGCNSHLKNNFNSYKTCQSVCREQSSRDSKCATVRCAQYTVCVEIGDSAQCISTDDAYGEYEPVCEEDGTYAIKQCNNDVCECVDPKTGDQVPESVTDGELLDCIIVEGKVRADKKDDKACPDNGRARFCENSGDSCRDCERRENGRNDGETGALRDDDDDNQDSDRGRPNRVTFDGTCARCETCPVGTKKKVCDAVCKQTECKNFPSAICEVNKCTCKEEFMANGVVVDCNRAQPLCNRTKHAQTLSQRAKRLQRMNNAQDEEEEEEEYVCGKDGSFEMKCTSTQCTCLDPTTLKPIGEKQDKNNVNCASAQRSRPEVINVAFTITEKDIVLTVAKTRQFEAAATKKFDRFKTFMDENIKFSKPKITKGSVKVNVEMSCDGECEEIDLFSQANFVVAEINQETETIEVDGETFTLTNANIDQIVTTAELYGPATEPTTPDDKDDNSVTIIVVVVILVVVLIVAAAVAAYCYMKKNKSKTDEMPFHDLRGQDNPTYKS